MEIRTAIHVSWQKKLFHRFFFLVAWSFCSEKIKPLAFIDIKSHIFDVFVRWLIDNLTHQHLLLRSTCDQRFIVIACLKVEFLGRGCIFLPPPKKKKRLPYNQTQNNERFKTLRKSQRNRLWKSIYTWGNRV